MNREEHIQDNIFYHVYNRGNDRDRTFGDDSDYHAFIEKMKELETRYLVEVPVFTLMPNHYHFIALQNPGGDLPGMMGALATSAAKRFNLKYGHIGHLFQGPYRHKFIPEELLWHVACYIHLNPVRAGLVKDPKEWKFSNFTIFDAEVEGRLRPRLNGEEEGDLLRGLWQGYAAYVREVMRDERSQKEWENRVLRKGYLPSEKRQRRG